VSILPQESHDASIGAFFPSQARSKPIRQGAWQVTPIRGRNDNQICTETVLIETLAPVAIGYQIKAPNQWPEFQICTACIRQVSEELYCALPGCQRIVQDHYIEYVPNRFLHSVQGRVGQQVHSHEVDNISPRKIVYSGCA
jgi:hypothetical protein